jgi:glycosyltransferase involved in cell wall biosynthesis
MAAGSRAFIRGLVAEGASVRVEPKIVVGRVACTSEWLQELGSLGAVEAGTESAIVHRCAVPAIDPYAPGRVRVAHVSLPGATVPEGYLQRLSLMDAVWVPQGWQADALADAGIPGRRIAVVPEPIELERFGTAAALDIPEAHGTVFVAPFEWGWRAEWDAVLDAWCRAFSASDDATLVLAVWSPRGVGDEDIQAELLDLLTRRGHRTDAMADVVILSRELGEEDMPALYMASDAVCAAAHARGGGRVAVEAMACGRAVIAPVGPGGGSLDATVGWPIAVHAAAVPADRAASSGAYAGTQWMNCDVEALAAAFREAHENVDERAARAANGPHRASAHDHRVVAQTIQGLLANTEPRLGTRTSGSRASVVIEGAVSGVSSLAGINREIARAFMGHGEVDLRLVDTAPAASTREMGELSDTVGGLLPTYPDVTIHHAHPPEFLPRSPGKSVQIAHWEYGPPPADWATLVNTRLDEVWVSSTWVRDWLLRTGMEQAKVKVVPLGIDPDRYHPNVEPMDLGDAAPGFRFLFVGGLAWRKGADLIANAFGNAFTDADDISLVIKTYGAGGPYRSDGCDELIEKLRAMRNGPRVHLITDDISDADMPSLYAACDCLVHPYRGEAFGMTMLEAMACGLPAIMPDMGAARDFADETTALLVPSHRRTIESLDATGQRMTEYPVVVEMDWDDLAAKLRWVNENREAARAIGAAAAHHAADRWTWTHVVEAISERVADLAAVTIRA